MIKSSNNDCRWTTCLAYRHAPMPSASVFQAPYVSRLVRALCRYRIRLGQGRAHALAPWDSMPGWRGPALPAHRSPMEPADPQGRPGRLLALAQEFAAAAGRRSSRLHQRHRAFGHARFLNPITHHQRSTFMLEEAKVTHVLEEAKPIWKVERCLGRRDRRLGGACRSRRLCRHA
jgi:hypothetical protein